jgi:DNA gyrase subunit A
MIISAGGVVIRTDVSTISVAGRATQGVRLMNLGEGDNVVAIATTNGKKMDEQNGDEEGNEDEVDAEVAEEENEDEMREQEIGSAEQEA